METSKVLCQHIYQFYDGPYERVMQHGLSALCYKISDMIQERHGQECIMPLCTCIELHRGTTHIALRPIALPNFICNIIHSTKCTTTPFFFFFQYAPSTQAIPPFTRPTRVSTMSSSLGSMIRNWAHVSGALCLASLPHKMVITQHENSHL